MQINKIRTELDLTQEEFARLLHVTRQTVIQWEQGRHKPSPAAQYNIETLVCKWKKRNSDVWQKENCKIEDIVEHEKPERIREILGLSINAFVRVLGCSKSEYLGWIFDNKPLPLHHQQFIKFLLQKKKEGKLKKLGSPFKDAAREWTERDRKWLEAAKKSIKRED